MRIFLTFSLKSFGDTEKSYTFASAFENERNLKQNELRLDEESVKRKSSLKNLHKTDKVVQEARAKKFVLG